MKRKTISLLIATMIISTMVVGCGSEKKSSMETTKVSGQGTTEETTTVKDNSSKIPKGYPKLENIEKTLAENKLDTFVGLNDEPVEMKDLKLDKADLKDGLATYYVVYSLSSDHFACDCNVMLNYKKYDVGGWNYENNKITYSNEIVDHVKPEEIQYLLNGEFPADNIYVSGINANQITAEVLYKIPSTVSSNCIVQTRYKDILTWEPDVGLRCSDETIISSTEDWSAYCKTYPINSKNWNGPSSITVTDINVENMTLTTKEYGTIAMTVGDYGNLYNAEVPFDQQNFVMLWFNVTADKLEIKYWAEDGTTEYFN